MEHGLSESSGSHRQFGMTSAEKGGSSYTRHTFLDRTGPGSLSTGGVKLTYAKGNPARNSFGVHFGWRGCLFLFRKRTSPGHHQFPRNAVRAEDGKAGSTCLSW